MSLELRSESSEDSVVIHCSGEIKAGEDAQNFRTLVADWLKQRRLLTVDLSDVKYMDSNGLGILVSLYSIARTSGATLKYANLVIPVDYSNPPSRSDLSHLKSTEWH